ncbi:DUF1697 domain-containing protein [Sporichthya polymorpha]|uniref:DUF1697 domain-containing protein n=1 Tax=Sporichthya polymorpha TaxID=35751 RepID=UPI00037C0DCC|nr:DUF1697 domain-containing protein [Sporichthya polymorpha]
MRYALLFRGVNVGGRTRFPMSDLRAALEGAGFSDVSTYLQSGNAVVSAAGRTTAVKVAERAREAIAAHLPWTPEFLVRSGKELAAVVAGNPWPEAVAEPKLLNVAYASAAPDPKAALDPATWAPDEWMFGERCVYLHYVASSPGRSRLAEVVCREAFRSDPDAVVTVRNWNTVVALAELTAG